MSLLRGRRSVVIAAVAALAVAGAAYAYWTTTGSGTGSATTGTSQAVTISQTNTVAGMYPGGPDQDIQFKVNNPAAGAQYVNTVTAAIASVVKISDGTVATGCTAADFTVTQAGTAVAQDLPNGDTAFAVSAKDPKIKMIDSASNQDACKNVKVNLTFTSN